jgi:sulfite dehydrogenase (cytochrome) subunit B
MLRLSALLLLGALAAPAWAEEQAVALKAGPGEAEVQSRCTICHSLDYVRTNAGFLSADGWKAEVAKMRGPFGAPIGDADAEAILRYLIANYGVDVKG